MFHCPLTTRLNYFFRNRALFVQNCWSPILPAAQGILHATMFLCWTLGEVVKKVLYGKAPPRGTAPFPLTKKGPLSYSFYLSNKTSFLCLHSPDIVLGLGEFETVIQTLYFISGLHNSGEFSQDLECLYQAMQTQEKSFLLLL